MLSESNYIELHVIGFKIYLKYVTQYTFSEQSFRYCYYLECLLNGYYH